LTKKIESSGSLSETSCTVCGANQLEVFFEISQVPVFCNLLWSNSDDAQNCPRGNIKLAFCPVCSHIMNIAFDPKLLDYTQKYENSLDYSPRFQNYMKFLANKLIKRYNLHGKNIISVGCGKGTFLSLLCELGNNKGIGFDPSFIEQDTHRKKQSKVTFIQDIYSEKYAELQSDFIECRQVLEHVYNPTDFVSMLRRSIRESANTVVFFEVPNALNIFCKLFMWDIIYEHYSYFTPISLTRLFEFSGFQVLEVAECFENQFLCLHALPGNRPESQFNSKQINKINYIEKCLSSFTETYQSMVEAWNRKLKHAYEKGQRVVIWGSGSKGTSFLNACKNSHIEYAVDINPEKQGKYVAGTGQQIVPPDFLTDYKPDIVIVMNPVYEREIRSYIKKMGLSPSLKMPV
jgi:SAM-dependent methyltransferase